MANGIGYDLIVKDDNCESIANEYYKNKMLQHGHNNSRGLISIQYKV